jgi:Putative transposase/Transposase zinc-binding domain
VAAACSYIRRTPEKTLLHRLVRSHWRTFQNDLMVQDHALPGFVSAEMEAYLRCGILAHGFVNVRCGTCRETRPVAFSCKKRGFCPSCMGRRMSETAAHLVENVFPDVKVRQWVLTVPYELRFRMARSPELCSAVLRIFVRCVSNWYRRRAGRIGARGKLKSGGVTVVQRFGSALALNVHFHTVMMDGVYRVDGTGAPRFIRVPAPSDRDVVAVASDVHRRVVALLAEWDSDGDDAGNDNAMDVVAAASVQSEFVLGRRCAMVEGFNVHANTAIKADDREGREHLLRYIARPPLSDERMSQLEDGRVALRLKKAWRDGTTHVAFTPEEFMEKLAALVPRPRANLVRYHGVFAPAAGDRRRIVPAGALREGPVKNVGEGERPTTLRRRCWAELMKRVFKVDVLECPRC